LRALEWGFREPLLCEAFRQPDVPGSGVEVVTAQWVGGIANLPGISWALRVRGGCLGAWSGGGRICGSRGPRARRTSVDRGADGSTPSSARRGPFLKNLPRDCCASCQDGTWKRWRGSWRAVWR